MSTEGYKPEQTVSFGVYDEQVPEKDRLFAEGEKVLLVENDDSGTEENPAFLAHAVGDVDKQAFVFASELGGVYTEGAGAENKKLKVKRTSPKAKAKAELAAAKKAKATDKAAAAKQTAKDKAAAKAAAAKDKAKEREAAKKAKAKEKEADTVAKEKAKSDTAKAKAKEKAEAKEAARKSKEDAERISHSPSIAKMVKEGGSASLKAAVTVADRIGSDFYTLGGLLYEIKEMAYYESIVGNDGKKLEGQPGFEEYIRSELGVEYRMAQHYINVYVVTRRAGIPESKVKGLKCSKIVALLPLLKGGAISKANWDEWADKAKTLKGDAYKDAVDKATVEAGIERQQSRGATANQVRFNFVLFDDRAKVAQKAIELAKSELPEPEDGEGVSNSAAFDLICSEWATMKSQAG